MLAVCLAACSAGGGDGGKTGSHPPDGSSLDGSVSDSDAGSTVARDIETLDVGRHPQVAIDADGNVMTLWEWAPFGAEPRCYARRRAFGSAMWGSEHDFVTPDAVTAALPTPDGATVVATDDYCAGNVLGVDGSGRAAALYIHSRLLEYTSGARDLWWSGMRAMFDPNTGWSEPEWVGQNARCCADYSLAMNAQGMAALGWRQERQLWVARHQPDGGWQEPVFVTENLKGLILDEIVIDDRGDGLAATKMGRRRRALRLEDGLWQPPVAIDDDGYPGIVPLDIAMNGDGCALVIWRRCLADDDCELRARRFHPISGWAAPTTLAPIDDSTDASNQYARVAIDGEGNGLAVWVTAWPKWGGSGEPELVTPRLDAARFRDGSWGTPETLHAGELGDEVWNPRVVLDGAGNGLVAWGQSMDPHSEYRVRSYSPATGFGPAETLEVIDGSLTRLELAMNAAGVGVAAWSLADHGRVRVFR